MIKSLIFISLGFSTKRTVEHVKSNRSDREEIIIRFHLKSTYLI